MPEYPAYPQATLGNQARVERPASRIDHQVTAIKMDTERVQSATERVMRHAHTLGFFAPPEPLAQAGLQAPTPVIANLDDALRDLDRALDTLAGSLNLFE